MSDSNELDISVIEMLRLKKSHYTRAKNTDEITNIRAIADSLVTSKELNEEQALRAEIIRAATADYIECILDIVSEGYMRDKALDNIQIAQYWLIKNISRPHE